LEGQQEKDAFEGDVSIFVDEVREVGESHTRDILAASRSLATAFTSYSLSSSSKFPFTTLPFFEVKAMEARKQSGVDAFVFIPFVLSSNKTAWEEYALENQYWIHQGLEHQGLDPSQMNPETISPTLMSFPGSSSIAENDNNGLLYAPVWQTGAAPTNVSAINLDLLTHPVFHQLFHSIVKTKEPAVSPVMDLSFLYQQSHPQVDEDDHDRRLGEESDGDEDEEEGKGKLEEPQSVILQPVFESFDESAEVVGFVAAVFRWYVDVDLDGTYHCYTL